MNNNNIIWKWNPEIEEWELPNFSKNKLAKIEVERIILEIKGEGNNEQEFIRNEEEKLR